MQSNSGLAPGWGKSTAWYQGARREPGGALLSSESFPSSASLGPSQLPAGLSPRWAEPPFLCSPSLPRMPTMGTPTRRKSHLLLLVAVALVSSPGKRVHLGSEALQGDFIVLPLLLF